jgi:HPt (histidine-containing phosphotransfer) domain-containing protein
MNIRDLSERLDLDEDTYLEVLVLFLDQSESDLERMTNALRDDRAVEFTEAAHSIKGAAANMGLDALSDLAKEAEMKGRRNSLDGADQVVASLKRGIEEVGTFVGRNL